MLRQSTASVPVRIGMDARFVLPVLAASTKTTIIRNVCDLSHSCGGCLYLAGSDVFSRRTFYLYPSTFVEETVH